MKKIVFVLMIAFAVVGLAVSCNMDRVHIEIMSRERDYDIYSDGAVVSSYTMTVPAGTTIQDIFNRKAIRKGRFGTSADTAVPMTSSSVLVYVNFELDHSNWDRELTEDCTLWLANMR